MITVNAKEFATTVKAMTEYIGRRWTCPIVCQVAPGRNHVALSTEMCAKFFERKLHAIESPFVASFAPVLVELPLLSDAVKRLGTKGVMDIGLDGDRLVLATFKGSLSVPVLNPDDTPFAPPIAATPEQVVIAPAEVLREMMRGVYYAASDDCARIGLNCVRIDQGGSDLRAIATDGHRLAMRTWGTYGNAAAMSIPLDMVDAFLALESTGSAKIAVGAFGDGVTTVKRVSIQTETVTVVDVAIDASFPDYNQVINPGKNSGTWSTSAKEFGAEVSRVRSLLAGKKSETLGIKVSFNGCIEIQGSKGDNHASGRVSSDHVSSDATITLGINSRYLAEALARMSENVTCEVSDEGTPIFLSDSNGMAVIMPMRL